MNIGIFTDTYKPQINGVVTSVCMLERELKKLGHSVYIFTAEDPNDKTRQEGVFRMPSVGVPFSPGNRAAVFFKPTVLARIGQLKLDIIHTQSEFPLGILGVVVSAFTRAPLVHTYHTMYEDYVHYVAMGGIFTKNTARRYSRVFCNRAKAVIAPVDKAKEALVSYGVTKKIYTIPTGVDFAPLARTAETPAYVREAREALGIAPGRPVAVAVGRVAKEKSVDTLVNAWPNVLNELPNAALVIVGDGPFLEELKALAQSLNVEDSVFFTGAKPHDEIGKWYHIGDVFLCASSSETQGLTYFEAFAAQTPVCVRADDSCKGYLEKNVTGYTFNTDGDCAAAIIQALKDENKNALASAAYRRIEPLSAANFAKAVENVYAETVKRFGRDYSEL